MKSILHKVWHSKIFTKLRIIKRKFISEEYDPDKGSSTLNVLKSFHPFKPHSAGQYEIRSKLTIKAINDLPSTLERFSLLFAKQPVQVNEMTSYPSTELEKDCVMELGKILDAFGSDKADLNHNYHFLYAPIIKRLEPLYLIVEIGIGTNNEELVSNMGVGGKPGASLRAFKHYCAASNIIGGDIDEEILFTEDRISTHYVDQTDPSSLEHFFKPLKNKCDLIIDDGLHTFQSSLDTLTFAIPALTDRGVLVIEDIGSASIDGWKAIANLLFAAGYTVTLLNQRNKNRSVFALVVEKSSRQDDDNPHFSLHRNSV